MSPVKAVTAAIVVLGACSSAPLVPYSADTPPLVRVPASAAGAGLVEKFVDTLVWAFWPVYLHQHGVSLPGIGWIVSIYGFTWGAAQFFTGRLSTALEGTC